MIAARRSPGGVFYRSPGGVRGRAAVEVISGALNGAVRSISIDANDKIICGGVFTEYEGVSRQRVIRLDTDGSLDTNFNSSSGFTNRVESVYIQDNGQVLCAAPGFLGITVEYGGIEVHGLTRINSNGVLDYGFTENILVDWDIDRFRSVNIGVGDSGKPIALGSMGDPIEKAVRLNSDGSTDATFSSDFTGGGSPLDIAFHDDGKIVMAGTFVEYSEESRRGIVIINGDGSLDAGFDPGVGFGPTTTISGITFTGPVRSVAVQEDGKVVCGGRFETFDGASRVGIARLNADGSLDGTFLVGSGFGGSQSEVYGIAIQGDGKIICGGDFTSYDGTTRQRIARLNTDGSIDTTFDSASGFNGVVRSTVIDADGKVLCGGSFAEYDGVSRPYLARLNADGTLDTGFYKQ